MKKEEMKVKENVPRILFEIFLHGEEKDKEKIGRTIKLFETQLNKARSNKNKCRIFNSVLQMFIIVLQITL